MCAFTLTPTGLHPYILGIKIKNLICVKKLSSVAAVHLKPYSFRGPLVSSSQAPHLLRLMISTLGLQTLKAGSVGVTPLELLLSKLGYVSIPKAIC